VDSKLLGSVLGFSPLIIFLVLWLFLVRRSRKNMATILKINEDLVASNREMVTHLKNIEDILRGK
jgi:hypothetical protein